MFEATVNLLTRHGMEVATLTTPTDKALEQEIAGCKLAMEDLTGQPVTMFSYPRGAYNRRVRQAVSLAGFSGARTTRELAVSLGNDPWRIPTTLQAFPHHRWIRLRHAATFAEGGIGRFLSLGLGKRWGQVANAFFEIVMEVGGVWHLWGRSWELEEHTEHIARQIDNLGRMPIYARHRIELDGEALPQSVAETVLSRIR